MSADDRAEFVLAEQMGQTGLEVAVPHAGTGVLGQSRDHATVGALAELDVALAGLFRLGRELCAQADEPGLAYLIAHAGRELVRGVVSQLEDTSAGNHDEPLDPWTLLAADLRRRFTPLVGSEA